MFREVINAIKAQLHDRAMSPLAGAFLLSWMGWNYRFVFLWLSDLSYPEKIEIVNRVLFANNQDYLLKGLTYPLITAAVLLFGYPYPSRLVFEFWRKQQNKLKQIQQKLDDETPLTKEEARNIRARALKAKLDYDEAVERHEATVQRLQTIIANLEQARLNPPPRPIARNDEVTEEQRNVLIRFSESYPGSEMVRDATIADTLKPLGYNILMMQRILDDLSNKQLMIKTSNPDGDRFRLSPLGVRVALDEKEKSTRQSRESEK